MKECFVEATDQTEVETHLHSNNGVNEEQHGDQQTNIRQGLEQINIDNLVQSVFC